MTLPSTPSNEMVEISEEDFILANGGCSQLECPKCKKTFKDNQIRNRHLKNSHNTKVICKRGRPETGGRKMAIIRDNLKRSRKTTAPITYTQKYHQAYAKRKTEEKELVEMNPGFQQEVSEFMAENGDACEISAHWVFAKELEEDISRVLMVLKADDTFPHRAIIIKYLLLWVHKAFPFYIKRDYDEKEVIMGLLQQPKSRKGRIPSGEAYPDFSARMEKYFGTKDGKKLKKEVVLLFVKHFQFILRTVCDESKFSPTNKHLSSIITIYQKN